MAGHVLFQYFQRDGNYEVWGTARKQGLDPNIVELDARDQDGVLGMIDDIQPDVVINCVGVLNQFAERDLTQAIYVNALFPHLLKDFSNQFGYRLIHLSTDCVFSGLRGGYRETDQPDGATAYARTKTLGEVVDARNVTIRTSIIGPERKADGIGLFHWFMGQTGEVSGYRNVFWNGVTTLELAKAVQWLMHRPITGLVHLAAPQPVSKYELLVLLKEAFGRGDIEVIPVDEPRSDKTLVNTRPDFTFQVSPYAIMLDELRWFMSQVLR